ncbi:hypothetical protein OKA05_14400 [Luteolibacter arcticus]|uniref:Calx-beta domain-containing protein n=1 Tax=Luteolibacter arcticus TaxID=1581411 RepID=A0ABT3GJR7_9BACT|nr:Calx-beta domain-containing protein [Luteolibacter arcticus]MCW1923754.1 hypothetical protein [Luteolibacter arcticus]
MKKLPILLLSSSLLTSASAQDPPVASTWNYSVVDQRAGNAGLFVLETGNGPEIFCSSEAGANVWLALKHDPATGDYQIAHVSDAVSTSELVAFQPVQVTGDATPELVLAHNDGTIAIYDATTRALVSTLRPRPGMNGFIARDLDGDGSPELICSSIFDLFVYDINGQEKWRVNGAGGFRYAIGQMDADPALEIATTGGKVVDAETHTVQWDSQTEWYPLTIGDIDGDGMDEVIVRGSWDDVQVYDVDTQALKWSALTGQGIVGLSMANVDSDPEPELLAAHVLGTQAYDLSASGLAEKWMIHNNPDEMGLTHAVGQLDGDSELELVRTTRNPDAWGARLRVAGISSLSEKWVSPLLRGPFVGVCKGDVTGDGIPEYVFASAQSGGKKGGRIQMLDTNTLTLTGVSEPVLDPEAGAEIKDVSLCDIDGDGRFEVAVTGVAENAGFSGLFAEVYRFDAAQGFVKLWSAPKEFSPTDGRRIEVVDVDANGDLEVVIAGQQIDSSSSSRIFVFDYDSRTEQWRSPELPENWTGQISVAISDVDADGRVEAMLGCVGSGFQVYDLGLRTLEQTTNLPTLTCVAAHAGWPEPSRVATGFWVGTNRGEVIRYVKNAQGIYAGRGIPYYGATTIRQIIPASANSMFTVTQEDRITLYEPHGIPKWKTELLPGQISQRLAPLHTVDGWEVFSNLGFGGSIFPLDVLDVERQVSLSASGALREGESSAATVVLTRHTAGPETMVVRFSISGTATPGVDFQVTGATQAADGFWEAEIPVGEVSATVTLTLTEDALPEGEETLDLMLAWGTTYGPSSDRVARLRIADDETVVGVYFAKSRISEDPAATTGKRTKLVFLRKGDLSGKLKVPFTLDGTATNGKDFTKLKKSVTFRAGEDRVAIKVVAEGDRKTEGDEALVVTLSPASSHGAKPGAETAELTIEDAAN